MTFLKGYIGPLKGYIGPLKGYVKPLKGYVGLLKSYIKLLKVYMGPLRVVLGCSWPSGEGLGLESGPGSGGNVTWAVEKWTWVEPELDLEREQDQALSWAQYTLKSS